MGLLSNGGTEEALTDSRLKLSGRNPEARNHAGGEYPAQYGGNPC